MKLTREQFEAFEAWLDAKLALATYRRDPDDNYGSLSESIRESETKAAAYAALVEEEQPEPVAQERRWRAALHTACGSAHLYGVINENGVWWCWPEDGSVWRTSTRKAAERKADRLNQE